MEVEDAPAAPKLFQPTFAPTKLCELGPATEQLREPGVVFSNPAPDTEGISGSLLHMHTLNMRESDSVGTCRSDHSAADCESSPEFELQACERRLQGFSGEKEAMGGRLERGGAGRVGAGIY